MKELKVVFLTVALVLLAAVLAYADTVPHPSPSVNIAVTARVPNNSPQIKVSILEKVDDGRMHIDMVRDIDEMNFGELTHTLADGSEAGVWYSPVSFLVLINTTSFGHKYEITSHCKGLSSGANILPAGSFVLTPSWDSSQGDMPADAVLGSRDSAVGDKLIYRSEPAASNRVIQAEYSLPRGNLKAYDGYHPESIPLDQPPGNYTGTVTISIAAI